MKLPQVSTAFMLASSMVQRAMAQEADPQANQTYKQSSSTADAASISTADAAYGILYAAIVVPSLIFGCCLCCATIEKVRGLCRNNQNGHPPGDVTLSAIPSNTNPMPDEPPEPSAPSAPPEFTGIPVADFGVASQGSEFVPIGQLSPADLT